MRGTFTRTDDKDLYLGFGFAKDRHFNKLKNACRLATRHDKTASSYLGFVQLVSIRLWTKHFGDGT